MKLWLDDLRIPDPGWTWAKTVEDAIELMETGTVEVASLDHDLGEGQQEGRKLVMWMAVKESWPKYAIAVHSRNPVGAEYMAGVIERYGPFERVPNTFYYFDLPDTNAE